MVSIKRGYNERSEEMNSCSVKFKVFKYWKHFFCWNPNYIAWKCER